MKQYLTKASIACAVACQNILLSFLVIQNPSLGVPEIKIEPGDWYYDFLNYQTRKIIPDKDNILFQTLHYDLIFHRQDKNWTVREGTLQNNENTDLRFESSMPEVENPSYKTITWQNKNYQYRVILDPNPFFNRQTQPQQVVLEILPPDTKEPIRQILYTLDRLKEKQTATHLGIPIISASATYNDRLFFSVRPEQRAKGGGIATIVSYDPQTQKFALIQPKEIQDQQITDFAIGGKPDRPTIWIATRISGEYDPYLPGKGLIAYRPDNQDYTSGKTVAYQHTNSPLIGAIPNKLMLEGEFLWIGTGNGICQLTWQNPDKKDSWSCWRFALIANPTETEIPIYNSLLAPKPTNNISNNSQPLEILWWLSLDPQTGKGRYEVKYPSGFSTKSANLSSKEWHQQGERWLRGFDQVSLNLLKGGPSGIVNSNNPQDIMAIRGDLKISQQTIEYYSGWVEDTLLKPYLTVIPATL